MNPYEELIAMQLDMDDELGTTAERGAARSRAAAVAQELTGTVYSPERTQLTMTLPNSSE